LRSTCRSSPRRLWFQGYAFRPAHLLLMAGSGMLHTAYFLLLDRAYRSGGDLSIVYPLAARHGPAHHHRGRGVGARGAAERDRPSPEPSSSAPPALLLAGNPFAARKAGGPDPRSAMGFALLTGCMIAIYTVWDKASMATWLIPPLLYDGAATPSAAWRSFPTRTSALPAPWPSRGASARGTIVAIALLSPLSYILVLTAMVVHAREPGGARAGGLDPLRRAHGARTCCARAISPAARSPPWAWCWGSAGWRWVRIRFTPRADRNAFVHDHCGLAGASFPPGFEPRPPRLRAVGRGPGAGRGADLLLRGPRGRFLQHASPPRRSRCWPALARERGLPAMIEKLFGRRAHHSPRTARSCTWPCAATST